MKPIVLISFVLVLLFASSESKATLLQHTLYSPAIADNYIGTNPNRRISVYVPKDYDSTNKAYPVVYFLGAYNWNADFASRLEPLFEKYEQTQPIDYITVMVDGDTPLRGSFYVDSKAHGKFATFILDEVKPFIEANYRVKTHAEATAIAGFSMGGTGALRFAATHPDKFGHVYALSPGIFDKNGLKNSFLSDEKAIARYNTFKQGLAQAKNKQDYMKSEFYGFQGMKLWQQGETHSNTAYVLAYGSAFTGNQKDVFGIHFSSKSSLLARWEYGFGELRNYYTNKNVLSKLSSIKIEVGDKDDYQWITDGSLYLKSHSELNNTKVKVNVFSGTHTSAMSKQLSESMLPHFQALL